MSHFATETDTHAHITVTKWCIVEYGTVGDLPTNRLIIPYWAISA